MPSPLNGPFKIEFHGRVEGQTIVPSTHINRFDDAD